MNFRRILCLFYQAAVEWNNDHASLFAAALAYYTIFSIAPIFIFLVTIASVVFSREDAQQWLFLNVSPFVGPEVMSALRSILDDIQDTPATLIATMLALGTFLFGASRVVSHLRFSFNTVWEIPPRSGGGVWEMVKDRLLIFLTVVLIGIFLVLLVAASAILSAAGSYLEQIAPEFTAAIRISDFLVTIIVGSLLFAAMFKFLPDAVIAWSDVWVGAMLTAFLFFIGRHFIGLYFGSAAIRSAYGAAGALVVVILWIYYSALIIFYGAEFTHVYARNIGCGIQCKQEKREQEREGRESVER